MQVAVIALFMRYDNAAAAADPVSSFSCIRSRMGWDPESPPLAH